MLFLVLQKLRGGHLDHERHDMSEHRETANAAMDQAIPCFAEDIASGRAEANRAFGLARRRNSWHRVRPVSFTEVVQSRTRKIPGLFTKKFTL
ncbi:MAG: hypothetical protein ACLFVO_14320 [Chloroflexaceae bacterium]